MCDDEGSCASEAQVVVDQIKARRVFILGLGAPSTYRCGRCGYWHHGSAALELPAISMKKQCATCGQPIEAFASEVLGTLVKCPGPHGGPATSRSILFHVCYTHETVMKQTAS